MSRQRTHQRRKVRFVCRDCGEPWSARAVNHQPACRTRAGLQSKDAELVAATVESFKVAAPPSQPHRCSQRYRVEGGCALLPRCGQAFGHDGACGPGELTGNTMKGGA